MVIDMNGEKYGLMFRDRELYVSTGGDQMSYGSFLNSQSLEKKNLTRFIFPWTDTWLEGFYETDNIIDGNVPYVMNGKTYVDICGGANYRGIAVEVIQGDNDLLYEKQEEKTEDSDE
jgi:hypothetical protein